MPSTASPFGLRPVGVKGSVGNAAIVNSYPVAATSTAITLGDPVVLTTGGTVTRAITVASDVYLGVFQGAYQTAPTGSTVQPFDQYVAASQSGWTALVTDDPNQEYVIQTTTTIANSGGVLQDVGATASINTTAGSTTTKNSAIALDQSTIGTNATLGWKILGLYTEPNNAVTDSYVNIRVKCNRHFFANAVAGI